MISISCNGSLDGCGQTLQTSATVSNTVGTSEPFSVRTEIFVHPAHLIRDECENSFDYESAASSNPELQCLLRLFHLSVLV